MNQKYVGDNFNNLTLRVRRRELIQKLYENKSDNTIGITNSINNLSNYNKKQPATLLSIMMNLKFPNQWKSITFLKPLA